ncbi:MAG TPA: sigma-70 family RNA polymerase sigma factor [Planctomycetota bacterium]|nr:sigma-70 family RNA polymerase sigma factor [Planctomycetota bacterium]
MQGNDYGDLIPSWKVKLIGQRARRFGFPNDEIPDLEQTIVMELLAAPYDPEGEASERTFVIAIIDRQLKETLRSRTRHCRRVNQEAQSLDADPLMAERLASTTSRRDLDELASDVQAALMGLTPTERAICVALSEGQSQTDIARERGCSRAAISKHIAQVAEKFRRWGLDAYVPGRRKPKTRG